MLIGLTIELSKAFKISPFELLKEETSEVIMFINYYLQKGDTENSSTSENNDRIRVNDETATGGWW